jgi:adenosylhomocysteine nucleosidase
VGKLYLQCLEGAPIGRSIILLIAFFLGGCKSLALATPAPVGRTPPLVIQAAFDDEMQYLRSQAKISQTQVINGRSYLLGRLAGKEVVLVVGGVSMVNAAMTAQTAIDTFKPSAFLIVGIAGGVNPALQVGDVAVPAQWAEYQEAAFARQTGQGWQLPPFLARDHENYGMMYPQPVGVPRKYGQPDASEEMYWFPLAPGMIETVEQVVGVISLERCALPGVCLESPPRLAVGGNGVSGPTFVDNADYREWIWRTFQADVVDMESAAVAHVAYVHDIPFIAFRAVSDRPGETSNDPQSLIFYKLAADNAARAVLAFIEIGSK